LGLQQGVAGTADAVLKILQILLVADPIALERITRTWNREAHEFAEQLVEKYRDCPCWDQEEFVERIKNAFRHAYWIGMITARYGPWIAKLAGDAHESGCKSIDSLTDRFHNAWAIKLWTNWNRLFQNIVGATQDEEALQGIGWEDPVRHRINISEALWKKFEPLVKDALKHRIEQELTQGKKCPPVHGGPFLISWDDPGIKDLPGYDPALQRFDRPGSSRPWR
jgi:hypothetical protein